MRRKLLGKLMAAAVGIVGITALSTQASAECHKKMELKSTGRVAEVSGEADVRSNDSLQRFKITTDAKVADGTTYVLYVNGLAAGTVTFLLNTGEAEFNNNNGGVMPNGAESVCSVSTVELRDANNLPVVLGAF